MKPPGMGIGATACTRVQNDANLGLAVRQAAWGGFGAVLD